MRASRRLETLRAITCLAAAGWWLSIGGSVFAADWYVGGGCVVEAPDGTRERPFASIQQAIDHSQVAAGDTIIVLPSAEGVPYGRTTVRKGGLIIRAEAGPLETQSAGFVVPDDITVSIIGFGITADGDDGIRIHGGARRTTVTNCILVGSSGHGISIGMNQNTTAPRLLVRNCVVYRNGGSGVWLGMRENFGWWIPTTTIQNSIINGNSSWEINLSHCPSSARGGSAVVMNSYVQSTDCLVQTHNLLSVPPEFIDAGAGDFRLRPDVNAFYWHAGLPGKAFLNPDGTRNTIGAFGGPAAAGFYDPAAGGGPVIQRVVIEPAGAGAVRVCVRVRETVEE